MKRHRIPKGFTAYGVNDWWKMTQKKSVEICEVETNKWNLILHIPGIPAQLTHGAYLERPRSEMIRYARIIAKETGASLFIYDGPPISCPERIEEAK